MVIRFRVRTQSVGNDFFYFFVFDRISNDEQIETVGRIVFPRIERRWTYDARKKRLQGGKKRGSIHKIECSTTR